MGRPVAGFTSSSNPQFLFVLVVFKKKAAPKPTKPPRKGAAVKIKIVGDALEKFLNRIHVLGP